MARKKILLIDSDPFWQKYCKIKFRESFGLDVVCAADTASARDAFNVHHPGVIVLDMVLPEEDGMSFLEEMKNKSWSSHVPIIVLSNMAHPAHVHSCIGLGASAYFNKRRLTHINELADVVRRYV